MSATPLPAFLIAYSDSDFTNPHEAVLPDEPKDCRGDFTHMGAKYWGYETRRHRATTVLANDQAFSYDHDAKNWLRIGLKTRAVVNRVTISTKWYTGNQVWAVSVILKDEMTGKETKVLDRVSLNPDAEHEFKIPATLASEAMIECHYEGGISRVNFFGTPAEQPPARRNLLEGAAITHVSNEHYGKPDRAVIGARAEMHMVGWESARTGFGERALFHLNKPAVIEEIVVDTYLHRLNAPLSAHVYGVNAPAGKIEDLMKNPPRWKLVLEDGREIVPEDFRAYMLDQQYLQEKGSPRRFTIRPHVPGNTAWQTLLPFAPLQPDTYHRFRDLAKAGPLTHILYMHYPNGGIHGLKMFGREN